MTRWVVRTRVMVTAPSSLNYVWRFLELAAQFNVAHTLELCDPFPAFEVEL